MTLATAITNADKFKDVLQKHNINSTQLRKLIDHYVDHHGEGAREARIMQAANIRKELNREVMSEKVLMKGLKIIGISESDIAGILAL